jgi:tRNA (guanosine-2'-O-)-methyltransferase
MLRKIESLTSTQRDQLIGFLSGFKTDERLDTFKKVLDMRTRYFTVLLENINHPHNASAVLRSCDCFGVQDVHIVDDKANYSANKFVAMGAFKWLDLKKYSRSKQNSKQALQVLKKNGYRIVATVPAGSGVTTLSEFSIDHGPAAFVFGTELTGISSVVANEADEFLTIPTIGFTESLNISVSAAIILQDVTQKLHHSNIDWRISPTEKSKIMLDWLRKSIPKVGLLEERFFNTGIPTSTQ